MNDLTKADDIDWEELLPKLLAYTHRLLNSLDWFRGKRTDTFLKGKKLEDYVYEAIGEYLANPEKFKPEKNDSLEKFLCFSIIRRLVWNDIQSKENTTTRHIVILQDESEDEVHTMEDLFPYIEATFDQQMDYDRVVEYIEEQIKDDKILENIYIGRCHFGLKRGEIITEFELGTKDYDNGVRRLNTILQTAATIFQIKAKMR